MLWICLHLPHLAIELRQLPDIAPIAITDGAGAKRVLIDSNTSAQELQIYKGMDVPSALLREPQLRLIERSKADERRGVTALASWAHQFTSDVCIDCARWSIWLEVGSSLRYFNGLAILYAKLKEGLAR